MLNNDILSRLRYTFDFNDDKMIAVFKKGGMEVTRSDVCSWLKYDDQDGFKPINDKKLAVFLNGLIVEKRGPALDKEGNAKPVPDPEKEVSNNLIIRKLKIAMNLKSEDLLSIMESVDFKVSKHEMSALFRNENHKHYRKCKDQFLRNFLTGFQKFART